MKAIVLNAPGGTENLEIREIEKPSIKENEVLISVKAISINPVDYKVRANETVLNMIYGDGRPIVLGWDIAGIVVAVGSKVQEFEIDDAVFGMINFPGSANAYAEFVSSPEDQLAKIPAGLSFEAAAATTLAALTALQVLQGRIKKNDRILIHAGSGGVGHFAIQIAKYLGAYVITTSSKRNKDFVLSLGADEFIDYREQAFEEELTDVDFVFDMFNGSVLQNSIKVVKNGGTIISIPTPVFSDEVLELAKRKNVKLSNIMVQSNGADMNTLSRFLEKGIVRPYVSEVFAFDEMAKAHQQLESGRTVGKVIVAL